MIKFFRNIIKQIPFGLHIMDGRVQVLQLKGDILAPEIRAVGQKEIPAGVVRNGRIVKKNELAENISELLSTTKPGSIKGNKCILALPGSQTFQHAFFLEKALEHDDIKEILHQKIEETIPLPIDEMQYKYSTLNLRNMQVVFVTAINKNIIGEYRELLTDHCGLEPIVFEPESISLSRNIPINLEEDTGNIFMNTSNGKVNWYLMWKGKTFDANSVAIDDLAHDINKSIRHFEEKSKRKVDNVIIFDKKEVAEAITNSMKEDVNLPVAMSDKYKLDKNVEELNTETVKGAALRGFEIEKDEINLA